MRILSLFSLLLVLGCSRRDAEPSRLSVETNTPIVAVETSSIALPPAKSTPLPTWYVFKIKAFRTVTFSDDKSFAVVEGVTMKDKEFKVKLVWDEPFKDSHPKSIEQWLKKSKADFDAGIPYVIAGKVLSHDPLTVRPDTVVANAPNFGAPAESVY